MSRPTGLANRFWAQVDRRGPEDCWPWVGTRLKHGYGVIGYRMKRTTAHRVAFFLEHDRWPEPNGLHVCDNPPCCNPAHIY